MAKRPDPFGDICQALKKRREDSKEDKEDDEDDEDDDDDGDIDDSFFTTYTPARVETTTELDKFRRTYEQKLKSNALELSFVGMIAAGSQWSVAHHQMPSVHRLAWHTSPCRKLTGDLTVS